VLLNQPVVIDNGSSTIKAGFAGSSKPKVSILKEKSYSCYLHEVEWLLLASYCYSPFTALASRSLSVIIPSRLCLC
jgi:hypothetical protein